MAPYRSHSNHFLESSNNMADDLNDLEDIKLTSEEASRLRDAFQDKKFLKLFQDYVEDINSKESRKNYEEEIIAMEKERGFDVKFLHPEPWYVMKFVTNGKKIFVNICRNEYAAGPTAERRNSGTEWKIPVILSKPREDLDKKGVKCTVIDASFHSESMERALNDIRFKRLVEDTAISTIHDSFNIHLERALAKYPKMKYKGIPPSVVLRRSKQKNLVCEPIDEYYKNKLAEKRKEILSQMPKKVQKPKYVIKYRDIIDMKDFSLMGYTDKCAPKEIVIDIDLPEVQNASEILLDVFEKKLKLESIPEVHHAYLLDMDLSYAVDKDAGSAQFNKANKTLNVRLPVKNRGLPADMNSINGE